MLDVNKLATTLVILLCVDLIMARNIGCDATSGQDQLVFAHVLFRHGDRNPMPPYPNDPWKDPIHWPEGFKQLTNIGKKQHHALGQFFAKRYHSLLGDGAFKTTRIHVQSTDVDRTIMSAQCNMAGLFPPDGNQLWNESIQWQPVPIHTIPLEKDGVLASYKPCARYRQAMEKYRQSPKILSINKKFSHLFQYLQKHTGRNITSISQAFTIYDTLWIQQLRKFKLPEWSEKVFPGGDLEWISNYGFTVATATPELARLRSGFLLREILNRLMRRIKRKKFTDKCLWMYSAHDETLSSFLNTLGLFDPPERPTYASAVLFELYKSADNYYIQIFFKNSPSENITPLNIPSCGTKCPIRTFKRIYAPVIPTKSFKEECSVNSGAHDEVNIFDNDILNVDE